MNRLGQNLNPLLWYFGKNKEEGEGERPYAAQPTDNLFVLRPNVQQEQQPYASSENPRLNLNKFFYFFN